MFFCWTSWTSAAWFFTVFRANDTRMTHKRPGRTSGWHVDDLSASFNMWNLAWNKKKKWGEKFWKIESATITKISVSLTRYLEYVYHPFLTRVLWPLWKWSGMPGLSWPTSYLYSAFLCYDIRPIFVMRFLVSEKVRFITVLKINIFERVTC